MGKTTAALNTTPVEDETVVESSVSSNVFGGHFSGCITPEKLINNILFGDSLLLLTIYTELRYFDETYMHFCLLRGT